MSKKTIYDLSKELNVAPSTISKALNNIKGVNENTRKMIIEYAKEHGYFANPTARALKVKRSYTIGILYSEESNIGLEHPFFSMILQSAKEYLEKEGYDLIFINPKANDYCGYIDFCKLRNLAGVLIISASHNDVLLSELTNESDFKIVATDYVGEDVITVLSDNKQGVKDLISYYIKCGVKEVGMICPTLEVKSFLERYETFIEECEKNNILLKKENIITVNKYTFEAAYEQVDNYLKNHKPPEALFALSDLYGVATIKALLNHNYKIPNDVSVVGFDDIELSRYITPSLSTIRQNSKKIGVNAAKLLLKQLNGEKIEKNIVRIPIELIIRDSSK